MMNDMKLNEIKIERTQYLFEKPPFFLYRNFFFQFSIFSIYFIDIFYYSWCSKNESWRGNQEPDFEWHLNSISLDCFAQVSNSYFTISRKALSFISLRRKIVW